MKTADRQTKLSGSGAAQQSAASSQTPSASLPDAGSFIVMSRHYVLDEHGEPKPVASVLAWARSYDKQDRVVKRERVGSYDVSTVFLGLDHSFGGKVPVLWETMVFGAGPLDQKLDRCGGSREQSQAMHERMCASVRKEQGL